ncbi:MAG: type I phosphomannose isomerase catalytic subunit [Sphingobium sp.]
MPDLPIYPLRFDPICQYRLWGGRRLADWIDQPLPDGPIGEAWLLSDRKDNPSRVSEGPLKGQTIADLIGRSPAYLLGKLAPRFQRFPLLLKFLDVSAMLSVQVHPSDAHPGLIPEGESGKTEGWVVLEAKPASRIYAGLKPGVTAGDLRTLSLQTVDDCLASFSPTIGQSVLVEAGTVHSLGDGVVVLEVQQNSDITFRLYDWDHVDPKLHCPRPLQIEQALQCIDMEQGIIRPVMPLIETIKPVRRERVLDCSHFRVWRVAGSDPFDIGLADAPTVLVCMLGSGAVEQGGREFGMKTGAVILLPAAAGMCRFRPDSHTELLEITVSGA